MSDRPDYPDGLCPVCYRPPDTAFDVAHENWSGCTACRTAWRTGYGCRTGGLTLDNAGRAEVLARMSAYRIVEPAFLPPPAGLSPEPDAVPDFWGPT